MKIKFTSIEIDTDSAPEQPKKRKVDWLKILKIIVPIIPTIIATVMKMRGIM